MGDGGGSSEERKRRIEREEEREGMERGRAQSEWSLALTLLPRPHHEKADGSVRRTKAVLCFFNLEGVMGRKIVLDLKKETSDPPLGKTDISRRYEAMQDDPMWVREKRPFPKVYQRITVGMLNTVRVREP